MYTSNPYIIPYTDCAPPNSPSNGALMASGKYANYTCDLGFSLDGPSSRECKTDGTGWSGAEPVCCKYKDTPGNGVHHDI